MNNKEFEFFTELKQLLEKYEVTIISNDDYIRFADLSSSFKDCGFVYFVNVENIEDYLNRSKQENQNPPKLTCHICKKEKLFYECYKVTDDLKNEVNVCNYCLDLVEKIKC